MPPVPERTQCRHDATVTTGVGGRIVPCPPWCAWVIAPTAADIIHNAMLEQLHGDASGTYEAVQQAIGLLAAAGHLVDAAAVPPAPQPGPLHTPAPPLVPQIIIDATLASLAESAAILRALTGR